MADFALTRRKLLAAASAASGATMDLIEATRNEIVRRRDMEETFTQLVDALRLAAEALATAEAGEEVILADQQVLATVTRVLEGE